MYFRRQWEDKGKTRKNASKGGRKCTKAEKNAMIRKGIRGKKNGKTKEETEEIKMNNQ